MQRALCKECYVKSATRRAGVIVLSVHSVEPCEGGETKEGESECFCYYSRRALSEPPRVRIFDSPLHQDRS